VCTGFDRIYPDPESRWGLRDWGVRFQLMERARSGNRESLERGQGMKWIGKQGEEGGGCRVTRAGEPKRWRRVGVGDSVAAAASRRRIMQSSASARARISSSSHLILSRHLPSSSLPPPPTLPFLFLPQTSPSTSPSFTPQHPLERQNAYIHPQHHQHIWAIAHQIARKPRGRPART
jgi:hypothetical protein